MQKQALDRLYVSSTASAIPLYGVQMVSRGHAGPRSAATSTDLAGKGGSTRMRAARLDRDRPKASFGNRSPRSSVRATDTRFVQVLMLSWGDMPSQQARAYWPIYAAGEGLGLVVASMPAIAYHNPPTRSAGVS